MTVAGTGDASGAQICSAPLFPKEVTRSVKKQMLHFKEQAAATCASSLTLTKSMLHDTAWKQQAMIELKAMEESSSSPDDSPGNSKVVQEIDVLTGREMVQNNTGEIGSICLVVRRPG